MKSFYTACLLLVLPSLLMAQQSTTDRRFPAQDQLNTWSVGGGFGTVNFFGDIKENDYLTDAEGQFHERRYTFHVNAEKTLNNLWGLQAEVGKGGMAGIRRQGGTCEGCVSSHNPEVDWQSVKFEGDYWLTGMGLKYNFSSAVVNREARPKVLMHGEIGLGLLYFRTLQTELLSTTLVASRGYDDHTPGMDTDAIEKKARQVDSYLKLGLSAKYALNDKMNLTAATRYYLANTDMLDATGSSGRDAAGVKNDKMLHFVLGVSYQLGKKKKNMEWFSPLDEMYRSQKKSYRLIEGMSKDSDGDGVADQFDTDNNTEEGVAVDGSGQPLDVDMDGVADYLDLDPFTNKGAAVNEFGEELDSDGDGVVDSKDAEPNSKAGAQVDHRGIELSATAGVGSSLPSIFFNSSSAAIRSQDLKRLSAVAQTLRNNPELKLVVVGHADSHGDAYTNEALGLSRAKAVRKHLVEVYGVAADRLSVETKGETKPLALTPAMKVEVDGQDVTVDDYLTEINRRVDFQIAE